MIVADFRYSKINVLLNRNITTIKNCVKCLVLKNGLYKNTESKDCSLIQKLVISIGTDSRMS